MPTTGFSRFLALFAVLIVVLNMIASGLSLQEGFWQKFLPVTILICGAVLLFHLLGALAVGRTSVAMNVLWMMVGAFGFFVATLHFLVLAFPAYLWTDQSMNALVVDQMPKLQDAVFVHGFMSPGIAFVLNGILLVVAFIGFCVEDNNPEFEPAT